MSCCIGHQIVSYFRLLYRAYYFLAVLGILKGNVGARDGVACDHALSLYLCNLFSGGGHDTFLLQITCKKARIWTFF